MTVPRSPCRATRLSVLALLAAALASAGCSNKQRLGQYDFRDRSLAVATIAPAYPEILARVSYRIDGDGPVESLLRVSSSIALEATAHQTRPKLDAAAQTVNVSSRMGARVLDGAARHLRARPVETPRGADYEIEVRVRRYGITASSWSSAANYLIDADLFLLDGQTGRRIWTERVRATQPVRPVVSSGEPYVDRAITAVTLANLSTEELERQLETLADFSADRLVNSLIRSLDQARR